MKWKNKEVKTKTKSQTQHVVLYLCCFDCSVDEVEARSLIGVSHDRLDRMVTRRYTTETVRINTSASDHFSINPISCTDADYGSGKRPGLKTPDSAPPPYYWPHGVRRINWALAVCDGRSAIDRRTHERTC